MKLFFILRPLKYSTQALTYAPFVVRQYAVVNRSLARVSGLGCFAPPQREFPARRRRPL